MYDRVRVYVYGSSTMDLYGLQQLGTKHFVRDTNSVVKAMKLTSKWFVNTYKPLRS